MIIATAGHVDHGKTLLVHALTGIETDRLEEEKSRGLTIDLGFAYIDDELGGRLGFIDVPGHIKFINNMLAGVGAIDYALLVIAADDGLMPQTMEHLAILDQLGINQGAIALTKIDRVDNSRIVEVSKSIGDALSLTSLKNIPIFPVSSITGAGIDDLKTTLCLFACDLEERSSEGFFRLAIDRCFNVKGSGLVVTGSVFAGQINEGDELFLQPQGVTVKARAIHTQNQAAKTAKTGDRCAINLGAHQLSRQDISRGNWLTNNPGSVASTRIDAMVKVLPEDKPLRHWTPVHIHSAANHISGRVATLQGSTIAAGETGLVQLILEDAINVCTGDRVILRDQAASRTIAGGIILDPYSPKRGRSKPERITYLQQLSETVEPLIAILRYFQSGIPLSTCSNMLNTSTDQLVSRAESHSALIKNDVLIHKEHFQQLLNDLVDAVDQWQEQHPQSDGLSHRQLLQLLPTGCLVSDAMIAETIDQGLLVKKGNVFHKPGFEMQLSEQSQQLWRIIEPVLTHAASKPPVVHDLAQQLNVPVKRLEQALKECVKVGLLIRPANNRYFLPQAMDELHKILTTASSAGTITVKEYRDATGIGRNLCIEILEYFDRQKITQRLGDSRKLLVPAH